MRIAKLIATGYGQTAGSETGFNNALFASVKMGNKMQDAVQKDGRKIYQLPLPLNNKQKVILSDMAKLSYSEGVSPWDNIAKVTSGFADFKKESSIRFFPDGIEGNLEAIRNKWFDGIYGKVPANKKKIDNQQMKTWVSQFVDDSRTFASNYLAASEAAQNWLREKAISDLRASGWKFIGYDQPGANPNQ